MDKSGKGDRAIPILEKKDDRLVGNVGTREYAIHLCYKSAEAKGYHIFALQSGGYCYGMRGTTRYKKYGKSDKCKDGKGGSLANDVYQIGGEYCFILNFFRN